jgi:hypothetical protein
MALAFDTLGYSKRLREAGLPANQADAHAEAARDFIMAELVTRTDLAASVAAIKSNIDALEAKLEAQSLRLTVRLGGLLVIGIGALAALIKLA